MKSNWLWDRKIDDVRVKEILSDPENEEFINFAALLLSRNNSPREVFAEYISQENFLYNWAEIKKKMKTDDWNNTRIEFWQAFFEAVKKKFEEKGIKIRPRKEPFKVNEFYSKVGLQLRRIREKMDLSQKEAAKKIGVSQQIISRIESGRSNVSLGVLKRTADKLGFQIEIQIKPNTVKKS